MTMSMQQFFMLNKKLFHDHHREFQSIFKVALNSYWDVWTGFDVIAFDDHIKPADDESTKDAILRQYGERAVKLVETLIGVSELEKETTHDLKGGDTVNDPTILTPEEIEQMNEDEGRR